MKTIVPDRPYFLKEKEKKEEEKEEILQKKKRKVPDEHSRRCSRCRLIKPVIVFIKQKGKERRKVNCTDYHKVPQFFKEEEKILKTCTDCRIPNPKQALYSKAYRTRNKLKGIKTDKRGSSRNEYMRLYQRRRREQSKSDNLEGTAKKIIYSKD